MGCKFSSPLVLTGKSWALVHTTVLPLSRGCKIASWWVLLLQQDRTRGLTHTTLIPTLYYFFELMSGVGWWKLSSSGYHWHQRMKQIVSYSSSLALFSVTTGWAWRFSPPTALLILGSRGKGNECLLAPTHTTLFSLDAGVQVQLLTWFLLTPGLCVF